MNNFARITFFFGLLLLLPASTYAYDHEDTRIRKATGVATTTYPNQYFETQGATTTANIFLPDGTLVATITATSTATSTYYVHPDHLGSTNVTTDSNSDVVQTLDYYPYGSLRIDGATAVDEPHKFTGHEFDRDTDLTYAKARYYEQDIGRFLSEDPVFRNLPIDNRRQKALTDPQLQNAYSYSKNNPVKLTDPEGESPVLVGLLLLSLVNQLSYYNDTKQMVDIIDNPGSTEEQKNAAQSQFYWNFGTGAISIFGSQAGLMSPAEEYILEGGQFILSGLDNFFGEQIYGKTDADQSQSQDDNSKGGYNYSGSTNSKEGTIQDRNIDREPLSGASQSSPKNSGSISNTTSNNQKEEK